MSADRFDILDAIGNTSMVRLRNVVPPGCADIFVKLECGIVSNLSSNQGLQFLRGKMEKIVRLDEAR